MSRSGVLQAGEPVLLIDRKKRRYLIDLEEGGEFHSHSGVLPHDELIGKPEGETYRSSRGMVFIAIRPTITDFVLKMPPGAQVVYPKDIDVPERWEKDFAMSVAMMEEAGITVRSA